MSVTVSFNGTSYSIPEVGDESWGEGLTNFFVAIPQGALQKVGGNFTLTANVNFGATYGLLSAYFSSRTANPSSAGLLRLAVSDSIGWRNNANGGNLLLSVNGSDQLVFNGTSIISNAITSLTGDVTATGPGAAAATIAANAVTLAKMAQVSTSRILGRVTASTGNVESLTGTQATTILDAFTGDSGSGGVKGLVPSPAAGDAAAQKFLKANGTWAAAGSSGGSKNYLTTYLNNTGNGDFELNATTGWALFNATLTSLIPTGAPNAGAASFTTFATTSTGGEILGGSYSLKTAASANFAAGQGFITTAFAIDAEDQAKPMTIKAYYKVTAGASNINASSTSANTFAVYIYDQTNAAWIQPAGVYGFNQTSGVGYVTATFQTASNSTTYQLAVICINASAGAATVCWDDFSVGPTTAPLGAVATDWTAFTPTGAWVSNTTFTGYWRRVGGNLEVNAQAVTSGAPTSAVFTVNIPFGLSVDTTKLVTASDDVIPVGDGSALDSGTNAYNCSVYLDSATSVLVRYNTGTPAIAPQVTQTAPFTFGASDAVIANFSVPIVGWSSNVQMSNDTDTRVVAFSIAGSGNQSIPTNVNTLFTTWSAASIDTHGAWNSGTSAYVIPVAGKYSVYAAEYIPLSGSTASAVNQEADIYIYKNAGIVATGSYFAEATVGVQKYADGGAVIDCAAGDTISIQIYQNLGGGSVNVQVRTFTVQRLSGPSVIAATDTVAARYTNTSGQSISNGSTTTVASWTKDFDTNSFVDSTTGIATIPVSGKYLIQVQIAFGNLTWTAGNSTTLSLQKNGASYVQRSIWQSQGVTGTWAAACMPITTTLNLLAGDTIRINAAHDESSARALTTDGSRNIFNIERIGN